MIPLRDANPSSTPQVVTVSLILMNILMWFYEVSLDPNWLAHMPVSKDFEHFVRELGFVPARFFASLGPRGSIFGDGIVPLFASIFMHGSWMHVIGNMWFLWIFGDNVEDRMGHGGFLIFYLSCGIIASLVHAMFYPSSKVPVVGASGAISGVLGAYVLAFPQARIRALVILGYIVRVLDLRAWVFLGIWIGFQVIMGALQIGRTEGAGVAYWAHIGGFAIGAALLFLFPKREQFRDRSEEEGDLAD